MFKLSIFFLIGLLVASCATIKAPKPEEKVSSFVRPKTIGTIQVPVEADLTFIFKRLDKELPKSFSGKQEQCEGVSFDYQFDRNLLTFSGSKNSVKAHIDGAYRINANYCVHCSSAFGKEPFCIVPRVYVSCGDDEPMRRIEIDLASKIGLTPDYRLQSTTQLLGLKSVDPCQFTFLKYDASKLIEKEITKALKGSLSDIDREIQKVNFKAQIEQLWSTAQKPISIPYLGFLYLNPTQISVGELNFDKNKVRTNVQLNLSPQVESSEISIPKTTLPKLGTSAKDDGFSLPVDFNLSYDSLNQIIRQNWKPISFKQGKKKIQIDQLTLLGPDENQLFIQVNFSGSKSGILYLKGRPNYDVETGQLSLMEIDYDLDTKSLLLKSGSWLFESKMQKVLEEKLVFDLRLQLENFRKRIEKEMNREISLPEKQKARFSGELKHFDLSYIHPDIQALQLGLILKGSATIQID